MELTKRVVFVLESGVTTSPANNTSSLNSIAAHKKSVKQDFEIININEFTQDKIKAEQAKYETDKVVEVTSICSAYHGGPLDNPKVTSLSIGEVVQVWDICFEKVKKETLDGQPNVEETANGGITSDEEVFEKLTGLKLNQQPAHNHLNDSQFDVGGKNTPEEFHSAVSESITKLTLHNGEFLKELISKGEMAALFPVVSGLALMRNKVYQYNAILIVEGKARPFEEQYRELLEFVESSLAQIVEYQSTLMATTILHDAESQRWNDSRPFYEDERISHSIQMWWFYLQGLRMDIWNSLPPKSGQAMMAAIFDKTLTILVTRYTTISPSEARIRQYKGDVTTILLVASEVLMWISVSVDHLFDVAPLPVNSMIRNIHIKCTKLLEAMSLICAPLHILYKMATDVFKPRFQRQMRLTEHEKRTAWLHLVRPGLVHSHHPESLKAQAHITLQAKILAYQPEPVWPNIVQIILCHDMKLAKLILLNFGAFIPGQGTGPSESRIVKPMTNGCKVFQCKSKCIGPADHTWPQAIGSGVVKVILHGIRSHDSLIQAFEPLFNKLAQSSWSTLDINQIWNPRRPIWVQSLIHAIEPHLIPAVTELLSMIESGKSRNQGQMAITMKEVIRSVHDIVEIIPVPLLRLCLEIESRIPVGIKPIADSVLVQLVVCGLYGIVSRLQFALTRARVPRETLDFVIAFGEALVNLKSDRDDLILIQSIATEILKMDADRYKTHEPHERNFDFISNDFSFAMSEITASDILSDESGQFAMKTLYRFLNYNTEWIQGCMGIQSSGNNSTPITGASDEAIPALIKPWGIELFPPPSPFVMMNHIGGSLCDNQSNDNNLFLMFPPAPIKNIIGEGDLTIASMLDMQTPWEEYFKFVLSPPANRLTLEKLMTKRHEFHIDEEDFVGVGSHIALTDGNVIPVSGALQPDERRMLENTFKIVQGVFDSDSRRKASMPENYKI